MCSDSKLSLFDPCSTPRTVFKLSESDTCSVPEVAEQKPLSTLILHMYNSKLTCEIFLESIVLPQKMDQLQNLIPSNNIYVILSIIRQV